jgi:hypothetical protein
MVPALSFQEEKRKAKRALIALEGECCDRTGAGRKGVPAAFWHSTDVMLEILM